MLWQDASENAKSNKREWFAILVSWPTASVIIALLVLNNRSLMLLVRGLLARVTKVSGPGGIAIEFTPKTAKEIRASFAETLDEFIQKADEEYSRTVEVGRIWQRLTNVMLVALPAVLSAQNVNAPRPIRGTIYVPDIVYKEYLYQLTKYFSLIQYGAKVEGRPGRRFSMRFGIIGRAWRLKESIGVGDALRGAAAAAAAETAVATLRAPQEPPRLDPKTRELIKDWGMFEEEAEAGSRGKPAYLCVVLKSGGLLEGLLFLDSPERNAFGDDNGSPTTADRVVMALEQHEQVRALAETLASEMRKLRESGPFLQVTQ